MAADETAHAAPLWLRAEDWTAAAAAVSGIASWRRIPAPLGWMVQATWRRDGADAAWPLAAELAWIDPPRLRDLASALPGSSLEHSLRAFDLALGDTDAEGAEWLPGWLLIGEPSLAAVLSRAEPATASPPVQAFRTVANLLSLERQGRQHDLVEWRRRLRDLQPNLFRLYMRTR